MRHPFLFFCLNLSPNHSRTRGCVSSARGADGSAEVVRRGFQLLVGAPHAVVAQERRAGLVGEPLDIDDRSGAWLSSPLVPAKAGTQGNRLRLSKWPLDSRLRGNERW